jgi:hypothetical protein
LHWDIGGLRIDKVVAAQIVEAVSELQMTADDIR